MTCTESNVQVSCSMLDTESRIEYVVSGWQDQYGRRSMKFYVEQDPKFVRQTASSALHVPCDRVLCQGACRIRIESIAWWHLINRIRCSFEKAAKKLCTFRNWKMLLFWKFQSSHDKKLSATWSWIRTFFEISQLQWRELYQKKNERHLDVMKFINVLTIRAHN